jgi:hypothetical protein
MHVAAEQFIAGAFLELPHGQSYKWINEHTSDITHTA